MIFELAADFAAALAAMPSDHPRRRMLTLLEEAIRRDIYFIARHPTTLFQCMWNSCWWHDCPQAAAHYQISDREWTTPAPWAVSAPQISVVLTRWRAEKELIHPGFIWLSSLRPPKSALGRGLISIFRGHEGFVTSLTWSPDGRKIASGSHDRTVRIWDVTLGREILIFSGHKSVVQCVAWSPDGQFIASGSGEEFEIRVWAADTGREYGVFLGHTAAITSIAWSPGGTMIVSGSSDESIRFWNIPQHKEAAVWHKRLLRWTPTMGVSEVAWSSDANFVAASSADTTIRILDARTYSEILALEGHHLPLCSVAWSPDCRLVAAGATDGSVHIWDWRLQRKIETIQMPEDQWTRIAWSPDGNHILCSAGLEIHVWCFQSRTFSAILAGHEFGVNQVAWAPDGGRFASVSQDKTVRLWSGAGAERLHLRGHENETDSGYGWWQIEWSPDGSRLATSSEGAIIHLWDADSACENLALRGHEFPVNALKWAPDGKQLLSGGYDGTARIWDAATGEQQNMFLGSGYPIESVKWLMPAGHIAVRSVDNYETEWDVNSGKPLNITRCADEESVGECTKIPPQFRLIFGEDETFFASDISGILIAFLPGRFDGCVPHPDGRRFAITCMGLPYLSLLRLEGCLKEHKYQLEGGETS